MIAIGTRNIASMLGMIGLADRRFQGKAIRATKTQLRATGISESALKNESTSVNASSTAPHTIEARTKVSRRSRPTSENRNIRLKNAAMGSRIKVADLQSCHALSLGEAHPFGHQQA